MPGALVAAAVTVAVWPGPAQASTAACGAGCTSPSNLGAGTNLVLAAGSSGFGGQSVVLQTANSTSKTQDFTVMEDGQVSAFVDAGIMSKDLNIKYGGFEAIEFEYVPGGVPSNECLAVNVEASPVASLTTCGTTDETLWILDGTTISTNGYIDLISGTSATYSEPNVLTYSGGALSAEPIDAIGGAVSPTQEWTFTSGGQSAAALAAKRP